MCLIAVIPAGYHLPPDAIRNGWQDAGNRDGAGYMFAHEGKLIVRKPFYKLKELELQLDADLALYGTNSHFVVHLRYATHGKVTVGNTHPHVLDNGRAALVHNGILDEFEPHYKSTESDTAWFCSTVLAHRYAPALIDPSFGEWLGNLIGWHNKFVILTETGAMSIVNEAAGIWDTGCWFSNVGYKPKVKPAPILPPAWMDRPKSGKKKRVKLKGDNSNISEFIAAEKDYEEDKRWRELDLLADKQWAERVDEIAFENDLSERDIERLIALHR